MQFRALAFPDSNLRREGKFHYALLAFLAFASLTLAACGGGGGGGGSVDAQAQNFRTAATALPKFGSVTQSSNVDANGRTTDQASVTFDGTTAEVTVDQADSPTFSFDSSDDAWRTGTIASTASYVPPGQTDVRYSYHIHEASESLFFASYIERGWGDSTNWYVRGYWLRGDSNPYLPEQEADVELGAYIDSPEIDSASPPTLPSAGTAMYAGDAKGVYYHNTAGGGKEIGQYIGDMTLNIDFATGVLDYCTGCTEDTLLYGTFVSADGEVTRFDGVRNELIYRATAVVQSDGTFETQNATLTRTVDSQRSPVASSSGTLGGTFSNIPDAEGNPRAVMGTGGGEYSYENGDSGAWVGSFIGTTK